MNSTKQTGFITNAVMALTVKSTSDAHDMSTVGASAAMARVYDEAEREDAGGKAEVKPQDTGYCPARRSATVAKLAKDHVRS